MCVCVCVCIFKQQIRILLFNKLDSYKILIDYKNLQAAFSDSDVKYFDLQSCYLSTLESSTPFFRGRNLLDLLKP